MASASLQYQTGAQSQVRVYNHSNHLRHPFISAYDFINALARKELLFLIADW